MPETFVIFITKTDLRKKGLPAYVMERFFLDDKEEPSGDETHLIFVNGDYKGTGPIADLVHDFKCKGANKMRNLELA